MVCGSGIEEDIVDNVAAVGLGSEVLVGLGWGYFERMV